MTLRFATSSGKLLSRAQLIRAVDAARLGSALSSALHADLVRYVYTFEMKRVLLTVLQPRQADSS